MRALFAVAVALVASACIGAGSDSAPAAQTTSVSTNAAPIVPAYVLSTLDVIRQTGRAPTGYRGGTRFFNDARDGGATLPHTAPNGDRIRYQEWDVHPWVHGVNRGAERLITGSDGSAFFTNDHYRTFVRVAGGTP
jgi:guanyl-specific ribonuclease Sa